MSWETYMKFPITYRGWLISRIQKEINRAHESGSDINSKAPHENSPEMRNLTGKFRQVGTTAPNKHRFT